MQFYMLILLLCPSEIQFFNAFHYPPLPPFLLTLSVNFYWIHTVVYLIFVSRQLFFSSLPFALFRFTSCSPYFPLCQFRVVPERKTWLGIIFRRRDELYN